MELLRAIEAAINAREQWEPHGRNWHKWNRVVAEGVRNWRKTNTLVAV